jgi:hypothetical protein
VRAIRHLTLAGRNACVPCPRLTAPSNDGWRNDVLDLAGRPVAASLVDAIGRPWMAMVGDDNEISCGPDAFNRAGLHCLAALAERVAVYSRGR